MAEIGMIGAGSWGTALTWLLTNNGHHVTVWSALEAEIEMLREKREQKDKLPGVILSEDTVFTTDLRAAVEGKDLLVLAVPSPFTRSTAAQLKSVVDKGQIIVNVAKGIEENSLMTLSQIIEEEVPQAEVAVLSGPSHAEEVGKGLPTVIVAGARNKKTAEYIQNIFMNEVFRVYASPDVLGIEIGAALKMWWRLRQESPTDWATEIIRRRRLLPAELRKSPAWESRWEAILKPSADYPESGI